MAEKQVGLRMASATKSDIKDLYMLMHVLEAMKDELPNSVDDFEHLEMDQKEKNFISQIFEDGEINVESLISYLSGLCHGFHRVVMGYGVLYDNTANPDLDYLDFNKSILEAFEVWNTIESQLKEGKEVLITKDSDLGKMILEAEKEVEDVL